MLQFLVSVSYFLLFFGTYFLLVVSLVVSSSAFACLESLASKITCYVSSGMLNCAWLLSVMMIS